MKGWDEFFINIMRQLTKEKIEFFMRDKKLRKQLPTKEEYSSLYWVVHFYEDEGHVCYFNFDCDKVYFNHRELENKGFVTIIRNKGNLKSGWLMGENSDVRFDYTVTPTQLGYEYVKITEDGKHLF